MGYSETIQKWLRDWLEKFQRELVTRQLLDQLEHQLHVRLKELLAAHGARVPLKVSVDLDIARKTIHVEFGPDLRQWIEENEPHED